jgi:hypothetical protein
MSGLNTKNIIAAATTTLQLVKLREYHQEWVCGEISVEALSEGGGKV